MRRIFHHLYTLLFLVAIVCGVVAPQAVYAQHQSDEHAAPQVTCAVRNYCQVRLIADRPLSLQEERWVIRLDDTTTLQPATIEEDEPQWGNFMFVADASNEMRLATANAPAPLAIFSTSLFSISTKLIEANPQVNEADLPKLSWSVFFIGADREDEFYSWCQLDEIASHCVGADGPWISGDSNLPANAAYLFAENYLSAEKAALPLGTPFAGPLTEAMGYFEGRSGPKAIICFCEGLNAGQSVDVGPLIEAANRQGIVIHVKQMWSGTGLNNSTLDASAELSRLAAETDGAFVPVSEENLSPIWQALTRQLRQHRYTVTFTLPVAAAQIQIEYQDEEGNREILVDTALPPVFTVPAPWRLQVNGTAVTAPAEGEPLPLVIAAGATSIDIQLESADKNLAVTSLQIGDKMWTLEELRQLLPSALASAMASAAETDGALLGYLTLVDSFSSDAIQVPVALTIGHPASSELELQTDGNGTIVVPKSNQGGIVAIPFRVPSDNGYEIVPQIVECSIGDKLFTSSDAAKLQCEIPYQVVTDGSELHVRLIDQAGWTYESQAPLALSGFLISGELMAIGGVMLLGILLFVVFLRLSARKKTGEETNQVITSIDAPTKPVRSDPSPSEGPTEKLDNVLPVAELKRVYCPPEIMSSVPESITICPNSLTWGIGRNKSHLQAEYKGATPHIIDTPSVSRVHALLKFETSLHLFILQDNKTPNGTYVNRTKLEPMALHPLRHGDQVQFGKIAYEFKVLEPDLEDAFGMFFPSMESVRQNPDDTVVVNACLDR
jgi:hypothetical protein